MNILATPGHSVYFSLFVAAVFFSTMFGAHADSFAERSLVIESDGWALHGDLQIPANKSSRAFAVLLHKAAGNRLAYLKMARNMAENGIASLRIDLRGHGESTNLGKFDPEISRYLDQSDPAVVANFALIKAGDQDIVAVLQWLQEQQEFADLPMIMMGSSYTGEEMAQAGAEVGYADIYVALAPGNFSAESIQAIDGTGVQWLFVRAENEMPFFPALFDSIRQGSETAEIWVLPGKGHATDLFNENPNLEKRLLTWITQKLADSD